jgi:putative phosphoribosyl transferase
MAERIFLDRADAGEKLAVPLMRYEAESPLVLGLACGGVPVAERIARRLSAPWDVWVVRKIEAPGYPGLGIGAVAEGGGAYLDKGLLRRLGLPTAALAAQLLGKQTEVSERAARFRRGSPPPALCDRTVIVVDDGIALGATVRAALRALRKRRPRRLILASPVAAAESLDQLREEADIIVCLRSDPALCAVSQWYQDFTPVSDSEVIRLLGSGSLVQTEQPAPAA